jgi:hypothetical protein
MSCSKEHKVDDRFQDYLNKIPEIQLPFSANSYVDLERKVEIADTLYKDFFVESQEILGKIKINDSITGIIYLYPGDIVFPELATYNKKGQLISQQQLVTLIGGSDGYNSNGSSFMSLNKDFHISITDTIQSFERDSVGIIIDSTWQVEVVNYKYNINPNGKITEIK